MNYVNNNILVCFEEGDYFKLGVYLSLIFKMGEDLER